MACTYECKVDGTQEVKNQTRMDFSSALRHRQALGIDELSDKNIVYGVIQAHTTVELFVGRLEHRGQKVVRWSLPCLRTTLTPR
jgi:hypothetical protein